jgi:16S rRNA (cytosine1402-N4)-methyltransferase
MTMSVVPIEPSRYGHVTVMPDEAVEALQPAAEQIVLDVTCGGGGHAAALLEACPNVRVLAFDRDPAAVAATRERLADHRERVTVSRVAFDALREWLDTHGVGPVDGVIADLGISSLQLDDPGRGMSFRLEGPLDMRMDRDSGRSALDLIETLGQDELANLIYRFGEERRSRRVARCIKQALESGALGTTHDLRRAIIRAVGPRRVGGVDPATRTFQALRIAVNGELRQLDILLSDVAHIVRPGGRVVLISFHSLEDRMVKRTFLQTDLWKRLTKKPLVPGELERARNPRARSAKLRAAERIELPESDGSTQGVQR